jgi:ribose/xylose/arabinose/galactoside ABC-type transport system permease subunit
VRVPHPHSHGPVHETAFHALARATFNQRYTPVAVLLIATLAVVSAVAPSFASAQNLGDLLVQSSPAIIIGCGMTLVVLTGEIDISVGSLLGLMATLMGVLGSPDRAGMPVPLVLGITLAAGAGVGLINGLLVTVAGVPSIIATLGTLTILRGTTEAILGGKWITDLPAGLRWFGTAAPAGLPVCVWVAIAVSAAALVLTRWSPIGLRIYAVGGNPDAATGSRVSIRRIKLFTFTLTGLLTAVAAIVTVPQQSVIEAGIGSGLELVVITAVVVGGTSIRGGYGGIAGTILAALLLGSVRTVLVFVNIGEMATYWERAIQGAFILAAVLADHVAGTASKGRGFGATA